MRGITPIVAIILLLMITIAITGFAFVFFSQTTESAAQAGEAQLEQQTQLIGESFAVDAIDKNKVIIRNRGVTELKNMKFYVDGKEVNITQGPSSIPINQLGTFVLNLSENTNPNALKISSLGSKTEQSVSGIMFNPCASDSDCSTPPQISCVNSSSTLRNYSSQGVCGSDGKCAYTPIDTQCGTNRCTLIDNSYDCLRPSCGGTATDCGSIGTYAIGYGSCACSSPQAGCYCYIQCEMGSCSSPSCQGNVKLCEDFINDPGGCTQQQGCSWLNPYCEGTGYGPYCECTASNQAECESYACTWDTTYSYCYYSGVNTENYCSSDYSGIWIDKRCMIFNDETSCTGANAGCTWTGP